MGTYRPQTPTGTFKRFVNAGKSKTRVISAVERYLLTKARDKSRSTTVLHPSEMVRDDWCHRASYYLLQGYDPVEEPASRRGIKTRLVFGEGHAIHSLWQSWFQEMGVLIGRWECTQCHYVTPITKTPSCVLHNQDTDWEYREVPVKSEALRISGHSDGILEGFDDLLLLEIKSVGAGTFIFEDRDAWTAAGQDFETAWKNLKSPFSKHVLQAQIYMKLLEGTEYEPKEALLLYQSKASQDVKEFVVAKSDFGITELFEAAAAIVEAVEENDPPACNIGGNNRCSKCEVYP